MPEEAQAMDVMVDVSPSMPHQGTTLASCLSPLMRAVGRPEWTMARLQGVLGHAFQFDMKEGGRHVNHDHLDWGPAVDILPRIAQFRTFMAEENDQDVDFPALKREARAAVRDALERGAPTLVWSPMSRAMRESHHHGVCWGLIVGYGKSAETYTVRHPFVEQTYSVRYDEVGQSEPIESLYMHVYCRPSAADEKTTHLTALQTAVAIAHATRFAEDDERNANRRATPHGFAAYELWRKAFGSKDVPVNTSHHHVEILMARRIAAADYLRDLVPVFPEAGKQLEAAASHYAHEMESLNPLHALCDEACERGAWTAETRANAGNCIGSALEADRAAIARIEVALAEIGA